MRNLNDHYKITIYLKVLREIIEDSIFKIHKSNSDSLSFVWFKRKNELLVISNLLTHYFSKIHFIYNLDPSQNNPNT